MPTAQEQLAALLASKQAAEQNGPEVSQEDMLKAFFALSDSSDLPSTSTPFGDSEAMSRAIQQIFGGGAVSDPITPPLPPSPDPPPGAVTQGRPHLATWQMLQQNPDPQPVNYGGTTDEAMLGSIREGIDDPERYASDAGIETPDGRPRPDADVTPAEAENALNANYLELKRRYEAEQIDREAKAWQDQGFFEARRQAWERSARDGTPPPAMPHGEKREAKPSTVRGVLSNLTHPVKALVKKYLDAPWETMVQGDLSQMVQDEADYRLKHGLFTADELNPRTGVQVQPGEHDDNPSVGGHNSIIRQQLLNGFPMMNPDVSVKQIRLYEDLAKIGPEKAPEANGFFEKLAAAGGNIGTFVVELQALGRLARTPARMGANTALSDGMATRKLDPIKALYRDQRADKLTRLGAEVGGAGISAAIGGEDPVQAMSHFGPIAQAGAITGRGAKFVAQGAAIGSQAAASGADLDEILIEAVLGPALFQAPDFVRYRARMKGAPYGDRVWREWGPDKKKALGDGRSEPKTRRQGGTPEDGPSAVQQLIYKWHSMSEKRPFTDQKGFDAWKAEMQATADAIHKLYKHAINSGEGMTHADAQLVIDFVRHLTPFAHEQAAKEAYERKAGVEPEAPPKKVKAKIKRPGEPPAPPTAPEAPIVPPLRPGGGPTRAQVSGAIQSQATTPEQAAVGKAVVEGATVPEARAKFDPTAVKPPPPTETVDSAESPVLSPVSTPETPVPPVESGTGKEEVTQPNLDKPESKLESKSKSKLEPPPDDATAVKLTPSGDFRIVVVGDYNKDPDGSRKGEPIASFPTRETAEAYIKANADGEHSNLTIWDHEDGFAGVKRERARLMGQEAADKRAVKKEIAETEAAERADAPLGTKPPETAPPKALPDFTSETGYPANFKQGIVRVGDHAMGQGKSVLTASGRTTTAFPRVDFETDRKRRGTEKRIDDWLRTNAIHEAKAQGHHQIAASFESEKPVGLPPATRDAMQEMLFGEQIKPAPGPKTIKATIKKDQRFDVGYEVTYAGKSYKVVEAERMGDNQWYKIHTAQGVPDERDRWIHQRDMEDLVLGGENLQEIAFGKSTPYKPGGIDVIESPGAAARTRRAQAARDKVNAEKRQAAIDKDKEASTDAAKPGTLVRGQRGWIVDGGNAAEWEVIDREMGEGGAWITIRNVQKPELQEKWYEHELIEEGFIRDDTGNTFSDRTQEEIDAAALADDLAYEKAWDKEMAKPDGWPPKRYPIGLRVQERDVVSGELHTYEVEKISKAPHSGHAWYYHGYRVDPETGKTIDKHWSQNQVRELLYPPAPKPSATVEGQKDTTEAAPPLDTFAAARAVLEPFGLTIDNPGGEWLTEKLEYVKREGFKGSVTGNVEGAPVSVKKLLTLEGENKEQSRLRDNPSRYDRETIDELKESMSKSGYDPKKGVLVWVRHDGKATIAEGNHRLVAAAELGIESVPTSFRWFTGSERAEQGGDWSVEAIARDVESGLASVDHYAARVTPQVGNEPAFVVGRRFMGYGSQVSTADNAPDVEWEITQAYINPETNRWEYSIATVDIGNDAGERIRRAQITLDEIGEDDLRDVIEKPTATTPEDAPAPRLKTGQFLQDPVRTGITWFIKEMQLRTDGETPKWLYKVDPKGRDADGGKGKIEWWDEVYAISRGFVPDRNAPEKKPDKPRVTPQIVPGGTLVGGPEGTQIHVPEGAETPTVAIGTKYTQPGVADWEVISRKWDPTGKRWMYVVETETTFPEPVTHRKNLTEPELLAEIERSPDVSKDEAGDDQTPSEGGTTQAAADTGDGGTAGPRHAPVQRPTTEPPTKDGGGGEAAPRTPRAGSAGTLGGAPPADGSGVTGPEQAVSDDLVRGGDGAPGTAADGTKRVLSTGSEIDSDGGMDQGGPGDGGPELAIGETEAVTPDGTGPTATGPSDVGPQDYSISKSDQLFELGHGKRSARANIEAIRLAAEITAEGRHATDEERAILVKYVGWGAAANIFNPYRHPDWQNDADALKRLIEDEVITYDEYTQMRDTVNTAFFTPPEVIDFMYRMVRRFGYRNGHMLEPSGGVGHFLGLMPNSLRKTTARTMVEMDRVTSMIAKLLYPASNVMHSKFEDAALPQGFFDLVIGNPPFGKFRVRDKRYPASMTKNLHGYFAGRGLDLTKPNGLLAYVLSSAMMDKAGNQATREMMSKMGEFLGAVRLHSKALPGTQVPTDVMFFRRRAPGETPRTDELSFVTASEMKVNGESVGAVNDYYHQHPEMVLGEFERGGAYSQDDFKIINRTDDPLDKLLADRVERFRKDIVKQTGRKPPPKLEELVPPPSHLPAGAMFLSDKGQLYKVVSELEQPIYLEDKWNRAEIARAKEHIALRGLIHKLFGEQAKEFPQDEPIRAELNKAYEGYVARHGAVSTPRVINKVRKEDNYTYSYLALLDTWNPKTKKATKGDILSKPIISVMTKKRTAENPADAVMVSMDAMGTLDEVYVAELLGRQDEQEKVDQELIDEGLAFRSPSGGNLIERSEYLSGNVRRKLKEAEAAMALDRQYAVNVEALREVLPPEKPAHKIKIQLGASWIPERYVNQFGRHLFGREVLARYNRVTGTWRLSDPNHVKDRERSLEWGSSDISGYELLKKLLSMKQPEVKVQVGVDDSGRPIMRADPARSTVAKIRANRIALEFEKWVLQDADRVAEVQELYNDAINAFVPLHVDGKGLTVPGMNPAWTFRPHQPPAIQRIARGDNTLVNMAVGSGKTVVYAVGAEKLKQIGTARKILISVKNATAKAFPAEARDVLPAANIVDLSNLDSKNLRPELTRLAVMQEPVTVIIPHSKFKMIPVGEATLNAFFGRRISELEEAIEMETAESGRRSPTVKEMQAKRRKLQQSLERSLDRARKMKGITFEEIGFDWLMFDESQDIKNLGYVSQSRVAGLGKREGSGIAVDFHMKAEYVQSIQNGRGVVLGTGTPLSNSMVEAYTIQRYLQPKVLEELGVHHLDAWLNTFAQRTEQTERSIAFEYKPKERVRKFVNAIELSRLFSQFTHTLTQDQLKESMKGTADEIPDVAFNYSDPRRRDWRVIGADAPEGFSEVKTALMARAAEVRARRGPPEPGEDNMLSITNDARLASFDLRLVQHDHVHGPNDKLWMAADKVAEVYQETTAENGFQFVAIDLGLNPSARTGGYSSVRQFIQFLETRGIPSNEIAFINDEDKNRAEVMRRANAGELRVLMGSIEKVGVGTNMQERMKAIHMLSPPFRPDLVTQLKGRGIRGGNTYKEVELYYYMNKGTADEWGFGLLFDKAYAFESFLKGDLTVDEIDVPDGGDESMTYEDLKAMASDIPEVKELNERTRELQSMRAMKDDHATTQRRLSIQRTTAQQKLPVFERTLAKHREDQAKIGPRPDVTVAVIEGKTYHKGPKDTYEQMGLAILDAGEKLPVPKEENDRFDWIQIGTLNGAELLGLREAQWLKVGVRQPASRTVVSYPFPFTYTRERQQRIANPEGENAERIESDKRQITQDMGGSMGGLLKEMYGASAKGIETYERDIATLKQQIAEADDRIGATFELEKELGELEAEVRRLDAVIQAHGEEPVVSGQEVEIEGAKFVVDRITTDPDMIRLINQADGTLEMTHDAFTTATKLPVSKAAPPPAPSTPPVIPHAPNYAYAMGMLTPEQRRWMRENPFAPHFGLGGMANIPDDRGKIKRWVDRLAERLQQMRPEAAQRVAAYTSDDQIMSNREGFGQWVIGTGERLGKNIIFKAGKGLYGQRWGMHHQTWRKFQQYHGGVSESTMDAELLREEWGAIYGDIKGPRATGENVALNNLLIEVAEGRASLYELPEHARLAYEHSRDEVRKLVSEFLLSPHLHKYAEAFGLTNIIEIIERKYNSEGMYLRMVLGNPPEREMRIPPKEFKRKRIPYIKGGMYKHRRSADMWHVQNADGTMTAFTDESEALEHANRELADNKERYGESVKDRVQIISPFSEEVLQESGFQPEMDFRIRLARTIVDLRHNVEILKLFDFINETSTHDKGDPGEFQMPNHPGWGPLAGRFVPIEVAENLQEYRTVKNGMMAQIWDAYNYIWKSSKTVWSLPTRFRDAIGMNYFWALNGIHPLTDKRWFVQAIKDRQAMAESYRGLIRENHLRVGFSRVEMEALSARLSVPNTTVTRALMEWVDWMSDRAKVVTSTYDWLEEISKHAAYLKARDNNWSHEDAVHSLQGFTNYAQGGDWDDMITRHPLGSSFFRFTSATMRVNIHFARVAPGRLLAIHGVLVAMGLFIKMLVGASDEEMELVNNGDRGRRNLTERIFQPLVPMRDKDGRLAHLDLRWMWPLANDVRFRTGPGGIGIPFILNNPLMNTAISLKMNADDFTGRPLWSEADARDGGWIFGALKKVWYGMAPLPGNVTRGIPELYKAATTDERSMLAAMLKHIFGIKISVPYVDRNTAMELIRNKFGDDRAEEARELIHLFNARYRKSWQKPITGKGIKASIIRQDRKIQARVKR